MPPTVSNLSDDPELEAQIRADNARLAEETAEKGDALGVAAGGFSIDDDEPEVDDEKTIKLEGMNLEEDAARVDELSDPDEEFSQEELALKPVQTLSEFQTAVQLAKINGLEYIEASRKVIYHFTKPDYPKNHFFHFQGVRVQEEGKKEDIQRFLTASVEDLNFGPGRKR